MLFNRNTKKGGEDALSDDELVKLYQRNGDMEVLGNLYQRYTGLVFGVCMKYFKSEEESKDAVMQIFEKLIETLKKHEVANFKSWLHVLTKNHCLMWLRSRKNAFQKDISSFIPENNMESVDSMHHNDENILEERLEHLKLAINELGPEQKKCVELFYLEEKCYKEIVDITGFELKKVKSYIQNGRRNLKIFMEKL